MTMGIDRFPPGCPREFHVMLCMMGATVSGVPAAGHLCLRRGGPWPCIGSKAVRIVDDADEV